MSNDRGPMGIFDGYGDYDADCGPALATQPATSQEGESLREARHLLHDLLAVVHRDGGQYVDAHGEFRATKDAVQIVAALLVANPAVAFVQKVADLAGDELDAYASSELRDLARETLAATPTPPTLPEGLRAVLEPFAAEADRQERTTTFSSGDSVILRTKITIGQLRRARAIVAQGEVA